MYGITLSDKPATAEGDHAFTLTTPDGDVRYVRDTESNCWDRVMKLRERLAAEARAADEAKAARKAARKAR